MTIENIIEKYLPMMQNLQQTVAGRKQLSMGINVMDTAIIVSLLGYDEEGKPHGNVYEVFCDLNDEEDMNEKFLKISTFIAHRLTVKPAEAELVTNIANN